MPRRPRLEPPDHHEDRRVRRHRRRRAPYLAARLRRARGLGRADSRQATIVKAVVETGRYGTKTVVCGAPNCRAGHDHGLRSGGHDLDDKHIGMADRRRRERRHARQRRGTRASTAMHAGILELDSSPAIRCPAARRTASSRSTTSPSRTGPICGATTAWRAKWPRSLGKTLRDPVKLDLLPQAPRADRRSRSRTSTCARVTPRWCSRTSRCSPRRCGCSTGWKRSA